MLRLKNETAIDPLCPHPAKRPNLATGDRKQYEGTLSGLIIVALGLIVHWSLVRCVSAFCIVRGQLLF